MAANLSLALSAATTKVQVYIESQVFTAYRTAGNFGEVFNLANWRILEKSPNLKSANIIVNACAQMRHSIKITKLKIR